MQIGSKQFNLPYFVTGLLTLLGKTNGTQTNAGHGRTEHVLITILACISICLSEEMKDKCIAIIQKCIIAKIII